MNTDIKNKSKYFRVPKGFKDKLQDLVVNLLFKQAHSNPDVWSGIPKRTWRDNISYKIKVKHKRDE